MILLAAVVLYILFKSKHLKKWKNYYPTILLLMIGDLAMNFITYKHPFWHYTSAVIPSHTLLDLLHLIVSFPCIVILFLGYMPNGLGKRVLYIVLVSALYAFIEYIMYLAGKFVYFNGWSTLHSFFFDIGLFSIVTIHYQRPLAAWLCIFVITPIFLAAVRFPLNLLLE